MNKSLVVLLAACALAGSSITFAAPVALTNAELDSVSAGSGSVFDYVFGNGVSGTEPVTATDASLAAADNGGIAVTGDENEVPAAWAADNGTAVAGEDNETNHALADNGSVATAGEDNTTTYVSLNDVPVTIKANVNTGEEGTAITASDNATVASNSGDHGIVATDNATVGITEFTADDIEDNDDSSIAVGYGNEQVSDAEDSNIVMGSNNTQHVDQSEVEGEVEKGAFGFVARDNTTITDSFNPKDIEIEVEVEIEDSYNVTTNTMDISGQSGITAIVNANALGDQLIGVNVALNSSSSQAPQSGASQGETPISAANGNSIAFMSVNQVVINGSLILSPIIGGFPGTTMPSLPTP